MKNKKIKLILLAMIAAVILITTVSPVFGAEITGKLSAGNGETPIPATQTVAQQSQTTPQSIAIFILVAELIVLAALVVYKKPKKT